MALTAIQDATNDDLSQGLSDLFFEVIRGPKPHFFSHTPTILRTVLTATRSGAPGATRAQTYLRTPAQDTDSQVPQVPRVSIINHLHVSADARRAVTKRLYEKARRFTDQAQAAPLWTGALNEATQASELKNLGTVLHTPPHASQPHTHTCIFLTWPRLRRARLCVHSAGGPRVVPPGPTG